MSDVRTNLKGKSLTDHEWTVLFTYANLGNQQEVADDLGVTRQTIKNTLGLIYRKLDVDNAISAFTVVGWLRTPDDLSDLGDW